MSRAISPPRPSVRQLERRGQTSVSTVMNTFNMLSPVGWRLHHETPFLAYPCARRWLDTRGTSRIRLFCRNTLFSRRGWNRQQGTLEAKPAPDPLTWFSPHAQSDPADSALIEKEDTARCEQQPVTAAVAHQPRPRLWSTPGDRQPEKKSRWQGTRQSRHEALSQVTANRHSGEPASLHQLSDATAESAWDR